MNEVIDTIELGSEIISVFYAATGREVTQQQMPGQTLVSTPLTPFERGRDEDALIESATRCEGTTQVRFYATMVPPFARVEVSENSAECDYVAPGSPLALVSKLETAATVTDPAHGRLDLSVSGGVVPRTVTVPGLAAVVLDAGGSGQLSPNVGSGTATVTDSSTPPKTLAVPYVIGPYVGATCDNPDSDNYVPDGANPEAGVCVFSPKLTFDAQPELVALGRPVLAVLHSARILWSTPAPAELVVTLAEELAGTLTINGYAFVAGPATQLGRFEDAETLAEALLALPDLAALYQVRHVAGVVTITALQPGSRFDLVATLSEDAQGIETEATPGSNTYHAERRADWGCWLEVWAVPAATYGTGNSKTGAVLAERLECRYRADNAYEFDIAEALRQFTGLSYDCSDRLIGYFLRYGETFAAEIGGFRRRKVVAETGIRFGLEAVEVVEPALLVEGPAEQGFPYTFPVDFDATSGTSTRAGWRRLSRRPGQLTTGGVLAGILQPNYAAYEEISVVQRSATGQTESIPDLSTVVPGGISLLSGALAFAHLERATYSLSGSVLLRAKPQPAGSVVLTFANGQGAADSQAFIGVTETVAKRTVQLSERAGGRSMFAATLPDVRRYHTPPLRRDVYEWLLAELGNSPAVWLETQAGPVPVNVGDFDAVANELEGTYSLSLEIEPCGQPARGVTN